ncbi:MAG TPA: hypothetical protein PK573_16190 [Spirochaetota bacterium]|nr:hypothetical protein [Spirochaetota bacterium]HRZ27864.1 hypothetical protein [Spirochaetota bacterium]
MVFLNKLKSHDEIVSTVLNDRMDYSVIETASRGIYQFLKFERRTMKLVCGEIANQKFPTPSQMVIIDTMSMKGPHGAKPVIVYTELLGQRPRCTVVDYSNESMEEGDEYESIFYHLASKNDKRTRH